MGPPSAGSGAAPGRAGGPTALSVVRSGIGLATDLYDLTIINAIRPQLEDSDCYGELSPSMNGAITSATSAGAIVGRKLELQVQLRDRRPLRGCSLGWSGPRVRRERDHSEEGEGGDGSAPRGPARLRLRGRRARPASGLHRHRGAALPGRGGERHRRGGGRPGPVRG
ncbi:unnamed protein product, partial [Prorocentrum cordatum]